MISVIIVAYNEQDYIGECIESVLNQTYPDFELIITDDASTDDTPNIIQKYADKDNRITLLRFEKNTPGVARVPLLTALQYVSGDYVALIDGDDWCAPNMLELLYTTAMRTGCQLVIGNLQRYNQKENKYYWPIDIRHWENGPPCEKRLEGNPDTRKKLLRLSADQGRRLIRRDLIIDDDIFPAGVTEMYGDLYTHWISILKADSFCCIFDVVYFNRLNRPGQSTGFSDYRVFSVYSQHDNILNYLKDNNIYSQYKEYFVEWSIDRSRWGYLRLDSKYREEYMQELRRILITHDPDYVKHLVRSEGMRQEISEFAKIALPDYF